MPANHRLRDGAADERARVSLVMARIEQLEAVAVWAWKLTGASFGGSVAAFKHYATLKGGARTAKSFKVDEGYSL